jgi:hypothetical protein
MENQNKEKSFTIIVNARPKAWLENKISFRQVVELAFGSFSEDPNVVYSVTFSKGEDAKREGMLVDKKDVPVKEGMIFNVSQTNKS